MAKIIVFICSAIDHQKNKNEILCQMMRYVTYIRDYPKQQCLICLKISTFAIFNIRII